MNHERNSVILVDENNREIGTEDKLKAHMFGGKLHRAFSIFILNEKNELLLQQRALGKYHAAGLWSNTCCSHPQPGEDDLSSAESRLYEELGFTTKLKPFGHVIYKAAMENELTEWEYDILFIGFFNGAISTSINEVKDTKWIQVNELENSLHKNPQDFSPWLPYIFDDFKRYFISALSIT